LPTARRDRFEIPEAQHQFPGGGIFGGPGFGFGGIGVGSGGFTGGALGGPGGGFLAPVITLQTVFGESFSAATIANAIAVADQQARLAAERGESGNIPAIIDVATSPEGLQIVLNLARGLFEILDSSGRKLSGGVTPEAALRALETSSLPPATGGGGGLEPLPFPRRSDPSRPLPLSHLRRSRRPSAKTCSARSRRSSPSCNPDGPRRRVDFRQHRQASPSSQFYPVEQSMSPSSSARRVIPPAYVVRVFQIRNNSHARSRSGDLSRYSARFGKHARTQTSSAELSSSF